VVVLTGASSGIGRATAIALGERGATLVFAAEHPRKKIYVGAAARLLSIIWRVEKVGELSSFVRVERPQCIGYGHARTLPRRTTGRHIGS
jgi:NAD(P)-dependent dehydrogenase (short-subunit alcohol dehydrogenase family)